MAGREVAQCLPHCWIGRSVFEVCPYCTKARELGKQGQTALGLRELEQANKPPTQKPSLPIDSAERKRWPLFSGLLRYFPAALANVSNHSYLGNEKHNPGQPLQHARGKSGDHEDCIVRHLVDASEHPTGSAARIDELRALAWRALALLQEECELAGHRPAPGATFNKESNGT